MIRATPAGKPGTQAPDRRPRPLHAEDFQLIAKQGFGDGWNNYAHAMAWFREHLYVGTSRSILAMVKVNKPPPALTHWPINSPDDVYQLDRRAHIWRYDPVGEEWEQVYRAPEVIGRTGEQVARDIGYRGCCVYQSPSDAAPCLYVCTWSSSRGLPPLVLRSENGRDFEDLPRPPWGDAVNTFRTLVPFRGRLYTTPTGSTAGYGKAQECVGGAPSIYEVTDPRKGDWREASTPGFGDPTNATVFEMVVFDDHLYAGTVNPAEGFQIWKTRCEGEPPYEWQLVVRRGALRGRLNEVAVSMVPFRGALYVGTGIINGGYDRHHKVGPAAAEIIRLYPDDSWDLVVGNPRVTPEGLFVPGGAAAAGFDNFFNGYVWRMVVHEGCLYAGTFKWITLLPWMPFDVWPKELADMVHKRGIDNMLEANGGFDLWCTPDGVHWHAVTRTGFGNQYNWGVRNMMSTPYGLFIGTANPFGPEVAVKQGEEWRYVPNRRGGLEVWLGRAADAASSPDGPGSNLDTHKEHTQ